MTPFVFRRGGGTCMRKPTASIRVGHVYLDALRHTLYCLNETARQMMQEGVPLTRDDLERCPLRTLEGAPVKAADLPLLRACRDREPREEAFLFTTSDGAVRHLTWNAAPLAAPDGRLLGVLASLTVAPFEPDWQHLAGLAHDLRTPLQALRLLMPLLESSPLLHAEAPISSNASAPPPSAPVDRTGPAGVGARSDARRPARREYLVRPDAVFARAGRRAPRARSRKAIGVETDLSAAHGLEIQGDGVRLGRLLSNLLSNAIRYTSRGEVRLTASWRRNAAAEKTAFVLGVEDTGPGISPEDQESIFQPFERGRAGKEGDSGGSGLGLAVVDRLVEELGLTLEGFSEYGRGSKFEVLLAPEQIRVEGGE